MRYLTIFIVVVGLTWGTTQAQAPRFKLRPNKKKATTTRTLKKKNKLPKKISQKKSITDRYRQKKRRRKKGRLHPKQKARIRR